MNRSRLFPRILLLGAAALPLAAPLRACFPDEDYDDYAAGGTSSSNGFNYSELGGGNPDAPAWTNAGLFFSEPAPDPAPVYTEESDGNESGGGGSSGGDSTPPPAAVPTPLPADAPPDPSLPPDPVSPDPAPPSDPVPPPDPPPVDSPPPETPAADAPAPPPAPAPAPAPAPTPTTLPAPDPASAPAPPFALTPSPASGTDANEAGPAPALVRIRFNAAGRDAHVVNQSSPTGSTFIWTDPGGLLLDPWPRFTGAQPAPAGAANVALPPVPAAPPGPAP